MVDRVTQFKRDFETAMVECTGNSSTINLCDFAVVLGKKVPEMENIMREENDPKLSSFMIEKINGVLDMHNGNTTLPGRDIITAMKMTLDSLQGENPWNRLAKAASRPHTLRYTGPGSGSGRRAG